MIKQDCDLCLSAGSVNQWGVCEVCGEEVEEEGALLMETNTSTASGTVPGNAAVAAAGNGETPAVSDPSFPQPASGIMPWRRP